MSEARKAELEKLEKDLCDQLAAVRQEIRSIKEAASPIQVGDIVASRGKEFRIVAHDDPEYGWFTGVARLKNGSWGEQRRRLYGNLSIISNNQRSGEQ